MFAARRAASWSNSSFAGLVATFVGGFLALGAHFDNKLEVWGARNGGEMDRRLQVRGLGVSGKSKARCTRLLQPATNSFAGSKQAVLSPQLCQQTVGGGAQPTWPLLPRALAGCFSAHISSKLDAALLGRKVQAHLVLA